MKHWRWQSDVHTLTSSTGQESHCSSWWWRDGRLRRGSAARPKRETMMGGLPAQWASEQEERLWTFLWHGWRNLLAWGVSSLMQVRFLSVRRWWAVLQLGLQTVSQLYYHQHECLFVFCRSDVPQSCFLEVWSSSWWLFLWTHLLITLRNEIKPN